MTLAEGLLEGFTRTEEPLPPVGRGEVGPGLLH